MPMCYYYVDFTIYGFLWDIGKPSTPIFYPFHFAVSCKFEYPFLSILQNVIILLNLVFT